MFACKVTRMLSRFRKDQSGAVAIEFALIGPILFALLFGIVSVGYYIGVSHSVNQLTAGAARSSVAGLDMQERIELAEAFIAQASTKYPLLDQDAVTPTIQTVATGTPSMTVRVTYAVDGSVLEIANQLLGLNLSNIRGKSYIAY